MTEKIFEIGKWAIIGLLVLGLVFAFMFVYVSSKKTPTTQQPINESVAPQSYLPQCNDDIDNDFDGFTDADDPNCTGPGDNSESASYLLFWVFALAVGGAGGLYFLYKKFPQKKSPDGYLQPSIMPSRAYDLAIHSYLRDNPHMPAKVIQEPDGFMRLTPMYKDMIISHSKFPFQHPQSREEFMVRFLEFPYVGHRHTFIYSLQRGEQYLKEGLFRIDEHTWESNFDLSPRTKRMSTAGSQQERLALLAMEYSDEVGPYLQSLAKLNSQPADTQYSLDTDEDIKYKMAIAQQNSKKNKKKKKQMQQPQQPSEYYDSDYDEGLENEN